MDAAGETTPERRTKRHLKDMKKSADYEPYFRKALCNASPNIENGDVNC
jgi:hypothetical protein